MFYSFILFFILIKFNFIFLLKIVCDINTINSTIWFNQYIMESIQPKKNTLVGSNQTTYTKGYELLSILLIIVTKEL